MQLNNKNDNSIKREQKTWIGTFSKEDIQMINKHMKTCSVLLVIKETNENYEIPL